MEPASPNPTVSSICDLLGRKEIAARLGVGVTAVSNAAVDGRFPSSWYDVISSMCAEAGSQCPRWLFKWKRADARLHDALTGPTADASAPATASADHSQPMDPAA